MPQRDRAFPILLWDNEIDEPFCTGCHACERACPVECMTVIMKDNPKHAEGKSKRRKIIDEFYIDYGRCMRCNICVEVCNFEAIAMNNTWAGHELSKFDRNELVLDLSELLSQHKKEKIDAVGRRVGLTGDSEAGSRLLTEAALSGLERGCPYSGHALGLARC